MHEGNSKPAVGATATATAIAFVAGMAIGLNSVGGYPAAASGAQPARVAHAPVRLAALPPEAMAAFALAQAIDAYASAEPRECTAVGDARCIR